MDLIDWFGKTWPADAIKDGDLATISTPIDFFGMDYYFGMTIQHDSLSGNVGLQGHSHLGLDIRAQMIPGSGDGLCEALVSVRDRYGEIPIFITEIGATNPDTLKDGKVDDPNRLAYIRDLLAGAHRAIEGGVDLRGIFVWSFLDGWEFEKGLSSRYGLVYTDYKTQKRIIKASGHWFGQMIAANGFDLPDQARPKGQATTVSEISRVDES
jgi:beta-glucosidase